VVATIGGFRGASRGYALLRRDLLRLNLSSLCYPPTCRFAFEEFTVKSLGICVLIGVVATSWARSLAAARMLAPRGTGLQRWHQVRTWNDSWNASLTRWMPWSGPPWCSLPIALPSQRGDRSPRCQTLHPVR